MTTYIDLTNRLLRRINEVEVQASQWDSLRGLQATAKDAILDCVREINNKKNNWVFNAVEHTQTLTVGQEEYPWPVRFIRADWNSFQLQKNDDLGVNSTHLIYINRDDWYRDKRDFDYDTAASGRGIPVNVFQAHGQGWGITPSPNEEYTIKYRYFKNPDDLSAATDEVTIPSRFDYVIIAGALYHLNLFKDNAEATGLALSRFNEGLKDMTRQLISWTIEAGDTRVPNYSTGVM